MAEMASRYPPGAMIVSTGHVAGSDASDGSFPNRIDRISTDARRLRTLAGIIPWSRRVVALCRAHEPGFIWCGNIHPAAYPASLTRRRTRVPYGLIVHGTDLLAVQRLSRGSAFKRRVARMLLGSASVIVANSRFTRDLLLDVCREIDIERDPQSVCVVPLGTDPEHFRPAVETATVRARYDLRDGRWLLTVANLVAHKGIDTGIRALAELRAAHPDLGYAIVGSGNEGAALRQLAESLGVQDRVRFLRGVPDDELPAIYNTASVYLGVSRLEPRTVEGFGISLVEALACGVPVIGGRSGGIPDTVREGETGLLVDPTDHRAVADAIDRLLRDPALAQGFGRAGRPLVESHLNWDRVTRDMIRIGQEFSHGARSPAPISNSRRAPAIAP
jgi:phosphatidylinositol alpha-1,6-mannosyltransferase